MQEGCPKINLPQTVVALGVVSLLMDLSSEMIHSVLPLFLVLGLGASNTTVGVIEGVGEATAAFAKVGAGIWSDRVRRRKLLLEVGYGVSAAAKPLFALAESAGAVGVARFVDRIGKGVRAAPRDALVADVTPEPMRGRAYGLRQALDSTGAILGPLAAVAVLALSEGNVQAVLWGAVLPAVATMWVLVRWVKEPPAAVSSTTLSQEKEAFKGERGRRGLDHPLFWGWMGVVALVLLARVSEAFVLLRAEELGVPLEWVPAVMGFLNGVYALSAYPFGRWVDSGRHRLLLIGSIGFLGGAHLVLGWATGWGEVVIGALLWGLHLGASQGLFSTIVAEIVPQEWRGRGFGIFHFVSGGALLVGSSAFGAVWETMSARTAFGFGAALAFAAAVVAIALPARRAPLFPAASEGGEAAERSLPSGSDRRSREKPPER